MNYNTRRSYSRKYQQLQKAMEVKYAGVVYRALRKQVREFISTLKTYGIEAARITVQHHVFNEHIGPAIRRLYLDAGMVRASQVRAEMRGIDMKKELRSHLGPVLLHTALHDSITLDTKDNEINEKRLRVINPKPKIYPDAFVEPKDNEILEKRASFGTNEELTISIIEYLQRFLLDKAVIPISETTRNWILGIIEQGVTDGLGAVEIARQIEGSEFLRFQALRIVRTEIVRATNVGAMKAAEASPFELSKEWISAHDARTRHSHRLVDGQKVDFEQRFTNGLLQPGDPNGPPEETINCRCTVAFVPKRDENGRLIRKIPGIFEVTQHPSLTIQKPGLLRRIMNFLNTG